MSKTVFQKIIDREIPSEIVYEDDLVIAIKDVNPVAPVHLLIIPKKCIPTLNDLIEEDANTVGRMIKIAKDLAKQFNIDKTVDDWHDTLLDTIKNWKSNCQKHRRYARLVRSIS